MAKTECRALPDDQWPVPWPAAGEASLAPAALLALPRAPVDPTAPSAAAEILVNGGAAIVSNREEATFRQALSAHGLNAHPLGTVAGFDYSNGQYMALTLYDVGRAE